MFKFFSVFRLILYAPYFSIKTVIPVGAVISTANDVKISLIDFFSLQHSNLVFQNRHNMGDYFFILLTHSSAFISAS